MPNRTARPGQGELDRLRAIVLALPGAVEKLSHGEPTWFTGPKGKVFAMFDDHHHGAAHVSVWLATPAEVQQALVAKEPARYFVPPYVGVRGWVGAFLDADPDWDAIEALARGAFQRVATPKTRRR
jgi:hypothetical protein